MKRVCSELGCESVVLAKGLCQKHWRQRRAADLYPWPSPGDAEIYFQALLRVPEGWQPCLTTWPYGRDGNGRPKIKRDGRTQYVARLLCRGEPEPGQTQCAHNCGEAGCLNWNHLKWATPAENEADKERHGTVARGERHGSAKLTESKVREIRVLAGKFKQTELAKKYNVKPNTISQILNRKTWAHLD